MNNDEKEKKVLSAPILVKKRIVNPVSQTNNPPEEQPEKAEETKSSPSVQQPLVKRKIILKKKIQEKPVSEPEQTTPVIEPETPSMDEGVKQTESAVITEEATKEDDKKTAPDVVSSKIKEDTVKPAAGEIEKEKTPEDVKTQPVPSKVENVKKEADNASIKENKGVQQVPKMKIPRANTGAIKGPIIIKNADLPPIFKKENTPKSTGVVGSMGGKGTYSTQTVPRGFVRSNASQRKLMFGKKKDGLPPPRSPRLGQVSSAFQSSAAFTPPNGKNVHNRKNYNGKKDVYTRDENKEREFEISKKKSSSPLDNVPKKIDIMNSLTVGELARKMNLKASEIITKLFSLGMMATINEQIDSDTATIIASEYGTEVHIIDLYQETVIEKEESKEENRITRAPIVTVMGHVDHGKTKLLDAIRNSDVVSGEFGGITQHIGAYKIKLKKSGKELVFIDTPGHAAFTMMRARGAQITDVVILVVDASEGPMMQTIEAIDHAKAANVPIVVALNKCDKESANPDRVMTQLSEYGLVPEEWGGNTQYTKISALKKEGIFELLETVLIQAEVMDLKADPTIAASGTVLEARIDPGRGVVATVLVREGTLNKEDSFVAGIYDGKIRAMWNDRGEKITTCGPSTPVEITGMASVPSAGDPFQVTQDEKTARTISIKRQELERIGMRNKYQRVTLDNMYDKIKEGEMQEFNVIIKGDVQGSVEALETALLKLSSSQIRLNVLMARAGAIIENDVNLAIASKGGALIIGFNVRPTPKAAALAESEKIEIRKYNVIYDVVDDVKAAMEGMLSPIKKEVEIGCAEVRDTFRVPGVGIVAGCMITKGKVTRKCFLKVVRDNIQISNGLIKLSSLKRFKDDASSVQEGFECGIGLENFQDIKTGDILEAYEIVEEKQKLDIPEQKI